MIITQDALRVVPTASVFVDRGKVARQELKAPELIARTPALARALRAARVSVYDFDLTLAEVPPEGTRVSVAVNVQQQAQTVNLRTLPLTIPNEGISFSVASCFDAQFKMGEKLRAALSTPLTDHAALLFQLWVGDNVYVDIPGFSGPDKPYEQTLDRYLKYLLHSSYAGARRLHPNFTTYDDHEFWNDYPEEQLQLSRSKGTARADYIAAAQDCLELFQSHLNLTPASANGRSFRIDFANASFFVADTRSSRTLAGTAQRDAGMMTPQDLAALKLWCSRLQQPGVLVLGQPLWIDPTAKVLGAATDHNPPFFSAEYQQIWAALRSAPFDILVISGDIHYSRMMQLSMQDAPNHNVYELISSPASEIPTPFSSATQFLFNTGVTQARTEPEAPGAVAGSGQKLKALCLFGTDSSNTFARVTLRPHANVGLKVGVSFVDYARAPAALADAKLVKGVPRWSTRSYQVCHESFVCMLRER